jgi:hypothetical protein
MAQHEAANMNLLKSMFELLNQFCYSAVHFLIENIIGISQERAISLCGLKGYEPVVDANLFLEKYINAVSFTF